MPVSKISSHGSPRAVVSGSSQLARHWVRSVSSSVTGEPFGTSPMRHSSGKWWLSTPEARAQTKTVSPHLPARWCWTRPAGGQSSEFNSAAALSKYSCVHHSHLKGSVCFRMARWREGELVRVSRRVEPGAEPLSFPRRRSNGPSTSLKIIGRR